MESDAAKAINIAPPPVTPRAQIACLCLSLCVLIGLFTKRIFDFQPLDPWESIQTIKPGDLNALNGAHGVVKVGFTIVDFLEFNVLRNVFEVDAIVWFEYDPTFIAPSVIDSFLIDRAHIVSKTVARTELHGGDAVIYYTVRARLDMLFNYSLFPYDDHLLQFMVTLPGASAGEVLLESSQKSFIIEVDFSHYGWRMRDLEVVPGIRHNETGRINARETFKYPAILFIAACQRYDIRGTLAIFMPLLLLLYIALFSFSLNPERDRTSILALTAACLTGMISYRFVIQNISPDVGYFVLSDYMFFVYLSLVFITFIYGVVAYRLSTTQSRGLYAVLHAFLIASSTYFFFG